MFKDRPFTVTLVCLYLLLWGSFCLVVSFDFLQKPDTQAAMAQIDLPYQVQVGVLYTNLVIMVVTAIAMFQEKNWARWVYLGWGLLYLGYLYFIQPDFMAHLVDTIAYPICLLLLLLPNANRWFSSHIDFVD